MHILSPETDNCPSWISRRERMTVENISWSISMKECCRLRWGLNPRPPGLQSEHWESGPHSEEDFNGMDMWNTPVVQSRQPLTYRLMESLGLGGPKWHGSSWQRGIAESGSSQLSTLMIDVPGDLVWDLPCMQQASYLEGGPLMWMLPLFLHVNQKSDYDDI